jgi:hypothetical protein
MGETMLDKRRNGNVILYRCGLCGKVLARKNELIDIAWYMDDCKHYHWEVFSVDCFYEEEDNSVCDPEHVKEVKTKYLLKWENDTDVYLLLPS